MAIQAPPASVQPHWYPEGRQAEPVDIRELTQGPRFWTAVVCGPGTKNPGAVKTLKFDVGLEQREQIHPHWRVVNGRVVGLESVSIAPEKWEQGTRFLAQIFAEDPDPAIAKDGWRHYVAWQEALYESQMDPLDPTRKPKPKPGLFPEAWIPQRIKDLQAGKIPHTATPSAVPMHPSEAHGDRDAQEKARTDALVEQAARDFMKTGMSREEAEKLAREQIARQQ